MCRTVFKELRKTGISCLALITRYKININLSTVCTDEALFLFSEFHI